MDRTVFLKSKFPRFFSYDIEFDKLQKFDGKYFKFGEIKGFTGTSIEKLPRLQNGEEAPHYLFREQLYMLCKYIDGSLISKIFCYDSGRIATKMRTPETLTDEVYNYHGEEVYFASYFKGELHGERRIYDFTDLRGGRTLSKIENYKCGIKDGLFKTFFGENNLDSEAIYLDGKCISFRQFENNLPLNGTRETWLNGEKAYKTYLAGTTSFKNGKRIKDISYYENGVIESIKTYDESGNIGLTELYDKWGKLEKII